jgi:hypothetical protein
MSDRPLESWLRDAIFEHPWDVLRFCFPEDFPHDSVPKIWRWKEFQTSAGRVDVLCAYLGRLVVVEVKRDLADENSVAQCLRYMGSIAWEYFGRVSWAQISGIVAAPRITNNGLLAMETCDVSFCPLSPAVTVGEYPDFVPPDATNLRLACSLQDIVRPGARFIAERCGEIRLQLAEQGVRR